MDPPPETSQDDKGAVQLRQTTAAPVVPGPEHPQELAPNVAEFEVSNSPAITQLMNEASRRVCAIARGETEVITGSSSIEVMCCLQE